MTIFYTNKEEHYSLGMEVLDFSKIPEKKNQLIVHYCDTNGIWEESSVDMLLPKLTYERFRDSGYKKFMELGYEQVGWNKENIWVANHLVKEDGVLNSDFLKKAKESIQKWAKELDAEIVYGN